MTAARSAATMVVPKVGRLVCQRAEMRDQKWAVKRAVC